MGYMDESRWSGHQTDDETHNYLVGFFHSIASEPDFQSMYHQLNDAEREKLNSIGNQAQK